MTIKAKLGIKTLSGTKEYYEIVYSCSSKPDCSFIRRT